VVDPESLPFQETRDHPVAITTISTGQSDNRRPQALFIIRNRIRSPLGRPRLTNHPTDTPLGNIQLRPDAFHAAPASVGT
jgi:hypothetical protein